MVSFQRITLSFLLVSGALFAYLIPSGTAHIRNDDAHARCRPFYHKQADGTFQHSDHGNLC